MGRLNGTPPAPPTMSHRRAKKLRSFLKAKGVDWKQARNLYRNMKRDLRKGLQSV